MLLACAGSRTGEHQHEADFRPLYTGVAPEDAAAIVQKLKETGVEYRLPTERRHGAGALRQAGGIAPQHWPRRDFRKPAASASSCSTRTISAPPNSSSTSTTARPGRRVGAFGDGLAEVEQARVHLTLPKESVFLDPQQPAKASVLVKLRPGAQMSPQNVLAVTNLVASAVEGLSRKPSRWSI